MPSLKLPKREAFCLEYMKDRIGTQAAIRAGYAPAHAHSTAHELLQLPEVQARIAELAAAYLAEVQQDAVSVLRLVVNGAHTGLSSFLTFENDEPQIDLAKATPEQIDTLQEITIESYVEPGEDGRKVKRVKIKAGDRNKSIDRLWEFTQLAAVHARTQADALASAIDQLARVRGSSMPIGDDA